MEEATITLYNVRKCGFYDELDRHQFASLNESMTDMLAWALGLESIGESATYSIDENQDDDVMRAFCVDIRDLDDGRFLLCTWNELPSAEDGVQLLQVNSQVGAATIGTVPVDPLSLPGYPAFFIIDASTERVLNLRFDRLTGSRQFQRYVAGFLASSSSWCVWNVDDETELLGYSDSTANPPRVTEGLVATFATSLARLGGETDYIRANVADIRKVVRRATISPEVEAHKTFLNSALKLIGLPVNNRLRADINFQYEFKTRLTPQKLESVIAEYQESTGDSWNDIGFIFARASQKVRWLSSSLARRKEEIDVRRVHGGMIDIDGLAAWARDNTGRLLDNFDED